MGALADHSSPPRTIMINILLPIAGKAKRFTDLGYSIPKPLIPVTGVPMIKLAVDSLLPNANPADYRLIFVVRDDHCATYDIGGALRNLFKGWAIEIATVDRVTQGTLCSCLIARDLIPLDEPLIVFTPDICFETDLDLNKNFIDAGLDGLLLTFKANSADHSYVAINEDGLATKTAEKVVISNDAMVGVYGYRTGAMFLECADKTIADDIKVNNEFYVAPMFNLLIGAGKKIGIHRAEKVYVLGTPEDLEFYEAHVAKYSSINKFAVCCDHSGFELKEQLLATMRKMDVDFIDFGTYSDKDSDHYDSLKPCAEYLLNSTQTIGIGICCTGQGFNIAANKIKRVRSVLIHDPHTAEMGRRHNAANFFCLPARSVDPAQLEAIVKAIINNSFDGGRHATRIRRISNDTMFSD